VASGASSKSFKPACPYLLYGKHGKLMDGKLHAPRGAQWSTFEWCTFLVNGQKTKGLEFAVRSQILKNTVEIFLKNNKTEYVVL
jgi:hypothetical protein